MSTNIIGKKSLKIKPQSVEKSKENQHVSTRHNPTKPSVKSRSKQDSEILHVMTENEQLPMITARGAELAAAVLFGMALQALIILIMTIQSHAVAFGAGLIVSFVGTSELILNSEYLKNQANLPVHCDSESDNDDVIRLTGNYREMAKQAAEYYGIPTELYTALIEVESAWNPMAVSHAGAIGLGQVMPSTGDSFCGLSKEDLFDAELNLICSASYLSHLFEKTNDWTLAVQSYNAGYHRIVRQGIIPKETKRYVQLIRAKGGNI